MRRELEPMNYYLNMEAWNDKSATQLFWSIVWVLRFYFYVTRGVRNAISLYSI